MSSDKTEKPEEPQELSTDFCVDKNGFRSTRSKKKYNLRDTIWHGTQCAVSRGTLTALIGSVSASFFHLLSEVGGPHSFDMNHTAAQFSSAFPQSFRYGSLVAGTLYAVGYLLWKKEIDAEHAKERNEVARDWLDGHSYCYTRAGVKQTAFYAALGISLVSAVLSYGEMHAEEKLEDYKRQAREKTFLLKETPSIKTDEKTYVLPQRFPQQVPLFGR